jgi:hypothetical protein
MRGEHGHAGGVEGRDRFVFLRGPLRSTSHFNPNWKRIDVPSFKSIS